MSQVVKKALDRFEARVKAAQGEAEQQAQAEERSLEEAETLKQLLENVHSAMEDLETYLDAGAGSA